MVNGLNFQQGEISLALFWRPYLSRYQVTRSKVEPPDLRGRYIYVVWSRQVAVIRRAEKPEPVGQRLKHSLSKNQAGFFCLSLQNGEYEILLPETARAIDIQVLGHLRQFVNSLFLEHRDVRAFLCCLTFACHDIRAFSLSVYESEVIRSVIQVSFEKDSGLQIVSVFFYPIPASRQTGLIRLMPC